ncbi:leucine-rich repeat flightless-interacting protein 1-like isoform X17 [Cyprinus carpio]|uniref:Leucine rich repeat (in FLII) interacting protein 1a n=2 Tax=Cyprinus carpio TaxID=7962 RepID=A0A9J7X5L1_CYPCA|nr:leucine-rich repeat flightless-interacting protein 1-like isoform X17 [Cyprinus carpio]
MGSQGPGRKRTPSKNGLTGEEDALNVIAKEAEARLAAKRAARAEAREIRMRELERQQKEIYQVQKKYYGLDNLDNKWGDIEQWMEDSERYTRVSRRHASVSDDEEQMSVGSRSNIRLDLDAAGAYGGLPQASSYQSHKKSKKKKKHSSKTVDDRLERDYLEKGSSRASTISGATLTSLGGTSSRRGSGDTSISADTEASIREIKEIHELKDQIQDVEAKHMQNLKELKDSLLEMEEKYRKAMVSNAQLDNEKTNMMYEVDTLKDSLTELEEMLFETRRELEEKCKDLEREKHAHSILQFQFNELKETLKQSEELLTEIRQLRLKQDGYVREISDLQETVEWKNKKIGALERQKEFSDAIRNERDELRDEVVQLKDILKKHGIVLGPDLATNGETGEEVGKADQNSQTASTEIREGSSVLGTHQLKVCKDQQQKDLDDGVPGNQQFSHAQFSSSNTPLEPSMENGELGDQMIQGVEQLENRPEEPPGSVGDDELTATRPKEEIKLEAHIPEDLRSNTVELESKVHKDGHLETDQQERECVKPSQVIKEETPSELVSGSVHDETDKPGETVLDDKVQEEPVESSQTEMLAKTQGASASNKKKKKKKKNKQKQKQSDKQESDRKIDDKNETVCSEDNPNQKMKDDLEGNHQDPSGNDKSETTMNTDVPHDAKRTSELEGIETTDTNINVDDAQDKILLVTDEADLAGISKTISNFDCPESANGVLSDDLSSNIISNPANIIDEHTEVSTNPDSEAVIFSCELVSSETKTSLPHESSAQSMDAVEGGVESTSSFENIELKSASLDIKEVESHLKCEVEEQEEKLENIDLDGTTNPEDQDDSALPNSPVMEKVENEAERVIQEQPVHQPMESQLQDSIGAELDQEEVETQDELDKENLKVPTEIVFDGSHVDNTPLIETQVQVVHEDLLSSNEAIRDSVGESDASDQKPNVEKDEEERSIQNQITLEVQLPEDEEELLVKSDVAAQELKEEDEKEEDEGESFDFDEMDLEASSDAPLKNFLDQPNEEVTLLNENVQEASQEHQSNVTDEDQTQEDEHLELADQESKPKEQKDDGQDTENPQTTTDVDGCLTEDSQINSGVRPNDQQHDITGIKEDAFEEHRQASEDVTLNEGVNLISEVETRNVGHEVNSSIHHEKKASNISGDQDVEKETTESNREDERKESKKSGKGKGKGKEDCKMS